MDIGTLTGRVEVQDQLSSVLDSLADKVKAFANDFEGVLGGLALGTGAVVAGIGAITAAVTALGVEGSKIQGVTEAYDHLAQQAGTTGAALREALSEGVKGTVDQLQLMQSTTKLLGSGMKLTTDQAQLMGEAARALGKATGTDATSGLDTLSSALVTGRVRALQQQIGVIDLVGAEKKYADALGITKQELTQQEQLHAKQQAILAATQAYVDRLGVSQLSFKERLQQGTVAFREWGDELSVSVATSPHVLGALDAIGKAITDNFGGAGKTAIETITGWIDKFADAVTEYAPIVIAFAKRVGEDLVVGFHLLEDAVSAVIDAFNTAADIWQKTPKWLKDIEIAAAAATLALVALNSATVVAATSGLVNLGTAVTGVLGDLGAFIGLAGESGVAAALSAWFPAISEAGSSLLAFAGGPVTLVIAGIVGLAVAVREATGSWDFIVKPIKSVWQGLTDIVSIATDVGVILGKIASAMIFEAAKTFWHDLVTEWHSVVDVLKAIGEKYTWLRDLMTKGSSSSEGGWLTVDTGSWKYWLGLLDQGKAKLDAMAGRAPTPATAEVPFVGPQIPSTYGPLGGTGYVPPEAPVPDPARLSAYEKAIEGITKALLGEGEKTKETSAAVDRLLTSHDSVIVAELQDVGVKQRMADAILKLIKNHQDLTAAQTVFKDQNASLFDGTAKQLEGFQKKFDETLADIKLSTTNGLSMEDKVAKFGSALESMYLDAKMFGKQLSSDMLDVLEAKWKATFAHIVATSKPFYTTVTADSKAWLKSVQDDLKTFSSAAEEVAKSNASITQSMYDAEIMYAERAGASEAQLLRLRVQQANAAYAEQIRIMQAASQKEKDNLAADGKTHEEAFKRIDEALDDAMTDAAIKHGIAVQKMSDQAESLKTSWSSVLSSIGSDFAQMGQSTGGALGAIMKGFGQAVPMVQSFTKSLEGMKGAADQWDEDGNKIKGDTAAMAQNFAAAASILYTAGNMLWDFYMDGKAAAAEAQILRDTLADLGVTLSQNTIQAIGQSNQQLWLLYTGADRTNKAFNDLLATFGGKVTPAMTAQIGEALNLTAVIKDMGGVTAATEPKILSLANTLITLTKVGGQVGDQALSQLSSALGELVGYAAKVGGAWSPALADLLNKLTKIPGGIDIIEKNWDSLVKSGTSGAGVWSDALEELISKMGSSAVVQAALDAQMANSAKGYAAALGVTHDAYATQQADISALKDLQQQYADATSDDQKNKIQAAIDATNADLKTQQEILDATAAHTQEAASAMAGAILGSVASEMATGKTLVQAITDQLPAIHSLKEQLDAAGLSGGAMFDGLIRTADLVTDKVAGPVLTFIEGITAGMVGASNAGQLSADQFRGLADQIGASEKALESQGKTRADVLPAMQSDLQAIWELQQKNHVALDEYTQGLVDEAVQDGLVGESHKSVANQMLDLTTRMTTAIEGLAKMFGVDLTSSVSGVGTTAETMAGKVIGKTGLDAISQKALDLKNQIADKAAWQAMADNAHTAAGDVTRYIDLIPRSVDVSVNYSSTGSTEPPEGGSPSPSSGSESTTGYATGGRVMPSAVRYLTTGSYPSPWIPRGTDTVPAMLTPDEEVLSVDDAKAYRAARAAPMPQSMTARQLVMHVTFAPTIVSWDGQDVQRWLDSGGDVQLTKSVVKVAKDYGLGQPQ